MKNHHKAETLLSVLFAIGLFALLALSYQKWQQKQTQRLNYFYQEQQALQIAENQIACSMAAIRCESTITQNELTFRIEQQGDNITVHFPLSKVEVSVAKN